jgi:hypothetical protein
MFYFLLESSENIVKIWNKVEKSWKEVEQILKKLWCWQMLKKCHIITTLKKWIQIRSQKLESD